MRTQNNNTILNLQDTNGLQQLFVLILLDKKLFERLFNCCIMFCFQRSYPIGFLIKSGNAY